MTTDWQDFRWKQEQAFEKEQRTRAIQQKHHDESMKLAQQRDNARFLSRPKTFTKSQKLVTKSVSHNKDSDDIRQILLQAIVFTIVIGCFYGIYLGILYPLERIGIVHEVASPSAATIEILLTTSIFAFFYRKHKFLIGVAGFFVIGCYFYLRWKVLHAT